MIFMKQMKRMMNFVCGCFLLLVLGLFVGSTCSNAAETPIAPSTEMGSAPEIAIGSSYYATMNEYSGYVSFVTPAEGGYVTVYYKNISIPGSASAYVKTATGEVVADDYNYAGGSTTWELQCEPGKRNGAELEPNTKYYLQVGHGEKTGNVLFSVSFRADANPDGKDQAEEIALNTSYTRSIDADEREDWDFFKFTTGKGGGHRLTISKTGGNSFHWYVRKWTTDELAKKSNGYDADDYFYGSQKEEDITLEANTTYYLKVWDKGVKNYTFSINNQSVTGISIVPSKTLAAGESFMLNPVITPATAFNKDVKYSSSNSDIAYVNSEGRVTASSYNCGTAVITVTAQDGSGVSAQCSVAVIPAAPSTPYVSSYSKNTHTISWSAQSGVSGYVVYVKSGNSWKAIKTTTGTSFKRQVKNGQKCQYRIRSFVGSIGKYYSAYSGVCYASTSPSATVKGIKVRRTRKKSTSYSGTRYYATISWKKVKNATAYQVYYRQAGSSYKYSYKVTNKLSLKTNFFKGRYSSSSRTYSFYVKPILKHHGTSYYGTLSKGKTYKFH